MQEWIDFPRDDIVDTSTGKFVPGKAPPAAALPCLAVYFYLCCEVSGLAHPCIPLQLHRLLAAGMWQLSICWITNACLTSRPRAGNGGSMEKCRRRWDLADAEHLKYRFMQVCWLCFSPAACKPATRGAFSAGPWAASSICCCSGWHLPGAGCVHLIYKQEAAWTGSESA